MNTVDFIKRGLDFAHRALADARNGTDAQLHFVPANGSHSIAWCLWHTARVEDLIVNTRILKQPAIWNAEWAKRTGLPVDGLGVGQSDTDAQKVHIDDMRAFAAYQEAVWAETARFLDRATEADLERQVPSRTGTESAGEAISLHLLGHFNGHRGEINTLRGLQGMPTVLAAEGTH
jgi:uncharacterized damage-inducible protein DinB